jgi:hypothetical protein
MSSIDIILCHDTEDVYTPAEAGMDFVPKQLAEIYSEEGLTANFMVIAQRAEVLKQRGRQDVIDAMRRHCIGVHTRWDGQPYDAVVVLGKTWDEGLEEVRKLENEACRIVSSVFDTQPVCLSAHALNEAPQMMVVARELGLPFNYSVAAAPTLYNISRFCGTMGFAFSTRKHDIVTPYFEGFDDDLSNEPGFINRLEAFDQRIDACLQAKQPVMLVHPCHPFKIYNLDWVDYYVSPNGVTIPPEEWPKRRGPGRRTPAQVELAMRNFRRLAKHIAKHPDLNVITIPEAVAKYGRVPASIGRLDLYAAAQRACSSKQVSLDERFTPAEIVLAWAEALLAFAQAGRLPESLPRNNDCLGPMEDPLITPEEPRDVGWPIVLDLASALLAAAKQAGHLPANLDVRGGGRAGLGSVYHLLARSYLPICQEGKAPESLDLWRFDRQPRIGIEIGQQYADLAESQLVPPDLDVSSLYRQGKLQSWTLAPCWYAGGA